LGKAGEVRLPKYGESIFESRLSEVSIVTLLVPN